MVNAPGYPLVLRLKRQHMARLIVLAKGAAQRHQAIANKHISYRARLVVLA